MAESKAQCSTAGAGGGPATSASPAADRPICAICYGDLCALSELIQSIPVCGHVFHELCLQHWIDYCPAGKEPACPVCKQCYRENPPIRLYFQSTNSSSNNEGQNAEQVSQNSNSAPALLPQGAVIRMELRISALDARVQDVDFKVNRLYRESAERELALLVEIEKQEKLHNTKITELAKKNTEFGKLKEKNSQLSKELCGLKLDNKKLTTRCNILGRSETRTEKKLDLARNQIKKLKERVEELQREQNGTEGKISPKKRKIETISSNSEKSEKVQKDLKNKKQKAATFNSVESIIKTRSMSAKKDLSSDEGRKIRVSDGEEKSPKKRKENSNQSEGKNENKGNTSRKNKVAKN